MSATITSGRSVFAAASSARPSRRPDKLELRLQEALEAFGHDLCDHLPGEHADASYATPARGTHTVISVPFPGWDRIAKSPLTSWTVRACLRAQSRSVPDRQGIEAYAVIGDSKANGVAGHVQGDLTALRSGWTRDVPQSFLDDTVETEGDIVGDRVGDRVLDEGRR